MRCSLLSRFLPPLFPPSPLLQRQFACRCCEIFSWVLTVMCRNVCPMLFCLPAKHPVCLPTSQPASRAVPARSIQTASHPVSQFSIQSGIVCGWARRATCLFRCCECLSVDYTFVFAAACHYLLYSLLFFLLLLLLSLLQLSFALLAVCSMRQLPVCLWAKNHPPFAGLISWFYYKSYGSCELESLEIFWVFLVMSWQFITILIN